MVLVAFDNATQKCFLRTNIGEIRIFNCGEKKRDDMRREYQTKYQDVAYKIKFYNWRCPFSGVSESDYTRINYIFHVAALKQVFSCEPFQMGAAWTYVICADGFYLDTYENTVK